jgi:hypothetical protein
MDKDKFIVGYDSTREGDTRYKTLYYIYIYPYGNFGGEKEVFT